MTEVQKIEAAEAASLALPHIAKPSIALPSQTMPGRPIPSYAVPREAILHRKLARVLERMGSTYLLSDILTGIAEGRMQSFAEHDSWAVCKVVQFPRARMLEIMIALGDIDECRILHDRILQFARDNDISLLQAYGRRGWFGHPLTAGWKIKTKSFLYQREL
jgi:hypothetical protein